MVEDRFAKSGTAPAFLKMIETQVRCRVARLPEERPPLRRPAAGAAAARLRYAFHVCEGEADAGSKPEAFNRGLRFALQPYLDRHPYK